MTELADLELSGRQPVNITKEVEQFEDYGYYLDERGIKHFGVIPKRYINTEINIQKEEDNDVYRIESSDPRVYERLLQDGIYRRN